MKCPAVTNAVIYSALHVPVVEISHGAITSRIDAGSAVLAAEWEEENG